jgi:hypothetical protein
VPFADEDDDSVSCLSSIHSEEYRFLGDDWKGTSTIQPTFFPRVDFHISFLYEVSAGFNFRKRQFIASFIFIFRVLQATVFR